MTLNAYFMLNSVFACLGLELFCAVFENNRVKTNTDIHMQSATNIYSYRDFSFWQYKVYADIHGGSLRRRRQTTVGSCVNTRGAVACALT